MADLAPITAAQMRKIEQDAILSGRVTGLELMERAGRGVVEAICETWPGLADPQSAARPRRASPPDPAGYVRQKENRKAVLLCGPGNNGGDGFVVARLLADRGWAVEVFFLGAAEKLPPDAQVNHARWAAIGAVQRYRADALEAFVKDGLHGCGGVVPVIDALFGIGQRAPMDAALEPLNAMIDAWCSATSIRAAPVFVAVDLPTGYEADTGDALAQRPAPADLVVTFHRPKPCHTLPAGPLAESTRVVKDIGL